MGWNNSEYPPPKRYSTTSEVAMAPTERATGSPSGLETEPLFVKLSSPGLIGEREFVGLRILLGSEGFFLSFWIWPSRMFWMPIEMKWRNSSSSCSPRASFDFNIWTTASCTCSGPLIIAPNFFPSTIPFLNILSSTGTSALVASVFVGSFFWNTESLRSTISRISEMPASYKYFNLAYTRSGSSSFFTKIFCM